MPSKTRTKFVCQACGYESVKWLGRCPGCNEWNTFTEEFEPQGGAGGHRAHSRSDTALRPVSIQEVPTTIEARFSTGIGEFDRVLGGGIVPGSLLLIGGDPGIGKSTLLLQLSSQLAMKGKKVLYISGEESVSQIRLRAERLSTLSSAMYVHAETDLDRAVAAIEQIQPGFLIIDSIQTMFRTDVASAPGSVAQVRECTGLLLRIAKTLNVATCIVGHVTKEGNIAGPRLLEHMVDAVLYFEGDRHHTYRILRAVKNRFGSTNELALFEMKSEGLTEVANPSEMFLSERQQVASGSAVVTTLEGTRPLLIEVQALVAPTAFGTPRRMASGADYNRMCLLLAVLERRLGLQLQSMDAYVNVAGGVRVDEPGIDLGVALALHSSFRDQALPAGDVYVGEVGLTGEVRSVSRLELRIREAAKLGFTRCIVPQASVKGLTVEAGIDVIPVGSLTEAIQIAL